MSFQPSFAGGVHPNAVIARREKERQEKSRLRRLSEVHNRHAQVRPSSANSNAARKERPSSAGRFSRSSSRPPSGQLSGHRQTEELSSLKSRVASSPSSSPGRWGGGPRSSSETAQLRTSFMLSPLRRMEDAASQFPVSTAEQARALQEELQSWYFGDGDAYMVEIGCGNGANAGSHYGSGTMVDGCPWTSSVDVSGRPTVDVLEEAAAAVKAKVAATDAFRIPPPLPGNYPEDRGGSMPGRNLSGGCRGVAAATAHRQFSAGVPRLPGS